MENKIQNGSKSVPCYSLPALKRILGSKFPLVAQPIMKIAMPLLSAALVCLMPLSNAVATTNQTATSPETQSSANHGSAGDASLNDLVARVRATAQKTNGDIGRLRIEKWKADSGSKKQAQASADSIQRNLTSAVPDLLEQLHTTPDSLIINFRLYRDLNALYDTFSSLTEATGAFAPTEQYTALASDLAQLDQARQKAADRVDFLAGTSEAELVRLRARGTATSSTSRPQSTVNKIVVDDNTPAARKKKKAQAPQP